MSNAIVRMNPATLPDAGKVGYSQISIANPGRLAFISGQVAWSADGSAYMTELNDATMVIVMTQITAFLGGEQPSLTGIGVASLANEDLKIEIEMVVQIPA